MLASACLDVLPQLLERFIAFEKDPSRKHILPKEMPLLKCLAQYDYAAGGAVDFGELSLKRQNQY